MVLDKLKTAGLKHRGQGMFGHEWNKPWLGNGRVRGLNCMFWLMWKQPPLCNAGFHYPGRKGSFCLSICWFLEQTEVPVNTQHHLLDHSLFWDTISMQPPTTTPAASVWAIPALQVFRFKCSRHARRSLRGKVFLEVSSCKEALRAQLLLQKASVGTSEHSGVGAV